MKSVKGGETAPCADLNRTVCSDGLPGQVNPLLGELAFSVHRVHVRLVAHHLHAFPLVALLVAVLADGVQLSYSILRGEGGRTFSDAAETRRASRPRSKGASGQRRPAGRGQRARKGEP